MLIGSPDSCGIPVLIFFNQELHLWHRRERAAFSRGLHAHAALSTFGQHGPEIEIDAALGSVTDMPQQWTKHVLGWLMAAGLALALFLGGSPSAYAAVFPFTSPPAAPATLEMKVSFVGATPCAIMCVGIAGSGWPFSVIELGL